MHGHMNVKKKRLLASSCLSIRPFVRIELGSNGWISMKFDIWDFIDDLPAISSLAKIWHKNNTV